MSDFEESISTLLGLIVLDNSPCLSRPPTEAHFYQSAAVYSIINHLVIGDIESAFRIYNHNGEAIQGVIYSHLLFISNNSYREYKRKLEHVFI